MYVQFTYDQAFNDLMMHLREKYPKEIFDIEGIGDQLDLNKFSKKFFSSKVTADASIDANANVPETTVVTYTAELKKPFEKINSYYILWKELRRIFNTTVANEAVERQLNGDIYIHDMHGIGAGLPYSYFGKTVVIVKIDGALKYLPLEDLYDVGLDGHEIKILDHDNTWTDITRIIRHKSHTNLVQLETKNGRCTTVTTDHPVILNGYSEKYANQLNLSDYLQISDSDIPLNEEKYVDIDYAYFLGFLIGDGFIQTRKCVDDIHLRSGSFIICQKDIIDAPIYTVLNKLFDNVNIIHDGRAAYCGRLNDVRNAPDIGHLSINKKLPDDILTWNKSAIKALICGLIDSDGNVEKSGIINIRTIAFSLTQQIGELIRTLNIGKVRTSYAGVYKSKSGFKSNNDVYRVSFRLTDTEMIKYSTKISDDAELVLEPAAKDGRYETTQLNKITEWNTPEYVYDITTESGHFHCQGLIQHNCWNFSAYDVLLQGLPMVTKIRSIPPKHLYAFKSQMEQFVTIAANSILGASGISDLLIVFSYYAKDVINTLSDGHFKFATEEDAWAFIKETLVSFIYTINLPMRGGQQCVTEDTEVLTPDGWKTYETLKVGDPIYTWHDGNLRVQNTQRVNVSEYSGKMHAWKSARGNFAQVVTPNHRVLHTKYNTTRDYILTDSSDLCKNKTPSSIPITTETYIQDDFSIDDDLLELLTIILCDGSLDHSKPSTVICKSDKRYGNARIVELLDKFNMSYHHRKVMNGIDTTQGKNVNVYAIHAEASYKIFDLLEQTKATLPTWFAKLSRRQAEIVINTWKRFDGHEKTLGYAKLQCDNYDIANKLQHVAMLAGFGSRIVERIIGNNKTPTIYVYTYRNINKTVRCTEIDYSGIVWCPTTEDGVVVFRKNGYTFISGNSPYTNVSIYDHKFLEEMQDLYLFPNGESYDIDFVTKLQELFIDIMNEELKRTPVTFPVLTACLAVDNERNVLDKEFLRSMVEKNLEFGFINFFAGKSSTISSCCFDGSQEVTILVDGEPKIVAIGTLDGIVDTKYADTWVKATVVKCKPATPMYKMILENGATTISTGDHIFVTDSGDTAVQDIHSSQRILCAKDYIPIQDIIEIVEEDTPEFVYCFEMLDQASPYFTLANGIISHNCRLRSDMLEDPGYTNSIGGSSTKIGSLGVVSLNLPRLAIKCAGNRDEYLDELKYLVLLSAKINHAKRHIVKRKIDEGMHPLYSLGFIDLDKQYSTVGINGLYESLEFMGMDILTQDGQDFVIEAMNVINNTNKKCDKLYCSHANCEQVPKPITVGTINLL